MSKSGPTHYDVLNVSHDFPAEAIKGLRKSLNKIYHPDSNSSADPDRLARINAACDVLGNPTLRKQYDRELGQQQEERDRQREARERAERVRS